MSSPHYLTTDFGQVRIWTAGNGPTVVALAGLAEGAQAVLAQLEEICPDHRLVVIEPPGLGGSSRIEFEDLDQVARALAQALGFLADHRYALVAWDLSTAIVPALLAALRPRPEEVVLMGAARARAWQVTGVRMPSLAPRDDGTHLNALWSFLRDRSVLDADDPSLPVRTGRPPSDVSSLNETFVPAATDPVSFARLWEACSGALDGLEGLADVREVESAAELGSAISTMVSASDTPRLPGTEAAPGTRLWHQYLPTRAGLAHLRCAGSHGDPVLVLPTGGGSSAQFAPVLQGLAQHRTVFAIDYFGNGLSEGEPRQVDVEQLAHDAVAVLDALDIDRVDLWGSHTGACVALELAIHYPERVGKAVMEGPVMVTPEFRADLLANYFPDFSPDRFGLHLQHVWNWRRDVFLFWPWYRVSLETARGLGLPTAERLQEYAVGILESGTSYGDAYRAGLAYDTASRLPLLTRPSIITAGPHDMLANALEDALRDPAVADVLSVVPTPTTMWWPDPDPDEATETLRIYQDFLGE